MLGKNTLILNEATVVAALQEYFDRMTVVTGTITVTEVTHMNGSFHVTVEDPKKDHGL